MSTVRDVARRFGRRAEGFSKRLWVCFVCLSVAEESGSPWGAAAGARAKDGMVRKASRPPGVFKTRWAALRSEEDAFGRFEECL